MKMAAFGLDRAARLAGIFLFPLGYNVIVGLDFEETFEDKRKALGGRLFERQNLDVVIIHSQVPAVAFEVGLAQVIVKEGVVLESGEVEFVRMEVERFFENAKGFLFVENPNGEEVADLEDEALCFLE